MKIFKGKKAIVYVLVGLAVLQAAVVGYSMVGRELFGLNTGSETQTASSTPEPEVPSQTPQTANTSIIEANDATTNTEISQEILDLIKQSDTDSFDRNISNYKDLLVKLDVHAAFKEEIERLIKSGHNIKDTLTAYSFLFDAYGKKSELEQLVKEKESGMKWSEIFKAYNAKNPEFAPRSFDSDFLEKMVKKLGLVSDDIMIADRVSYKTSLKIDDVINLRLNTPKWKVINASLDILNSQQRLPYIPVTAAEVNKFVSGDMTEKKVVQAFVIANKFNAVPFEVVAYMKDGMTNEEIYAKCLEAKYY